MEGFKGILQVILKFQGLNLLATKTKLLDERRNEIWYQKILFGNL